MESRRKFLISVVSQKQPLLRLYDIQGRRRARRIPLLLLASRGRLWKRYTASVVFHLACASLLLHVPRRKRSVTKRMKVKRREEKCYFRKKKRTRRRTRIGCTFRCVSIWHLAPFPLPSPNQPRAQVSSVSKTPFHTKRMRAKHARGRVPRKAPSVGVEGERGPGVAPRTLPPPPHRLL